MTSAKAMASRAKSSPLKATPVSTPLRNSSRTRLKRMGDSGSPCHTSVVGSTSNSSLLYCRSVADVE